jgi:hypothetical protein
MILTLLCVAMFQPGQYELILGANCVDNRMRWSRMELSGAAEIMRRLSLLTSREHTFWQVYDLVVLGKPFGAASAVGRPKICPDFGNTAS